MAAIRTTIPKAIMKVGVHNIAESKDALRKKLAARPIAEKLRMLDALRERTLSIRRAARSGPAKKKTLFKRPLLSPDVLAPASPTFDLPEGFMFQLTAEEAAALRSQIELPSLLRPSLKLRRAEKAPT